MDQDVEDALESELCKTYGRCRCCLELGYVKNMWSEYLCDGAHEIYGEMLMETFSVAWESNQNENELICHMCVDRLRDAHMFKREVLASEQLLKEGLLESKPETKIKDENLSDLDQYENMSQDVTTDFYCKEESDQEFEDPEMKEEVEFEEVEYLEDEVTPDMLQNIKETKPVIEGESSKQSTGQRKHPKRQRVFGLNTRNYKNYTEECLRKSIEVALKSDRKISEVAAEFGVPRKTLTARLYNLKNARKPKTPKDIEKLQSQEQHYRFVQEVRKVLSFTNAMPFKIKAGRYYCAYCYTTTDCFDSPQDLRLHMSLHTDERVKRLDQILRPQFLNEILRVDADNLQCDVCSVPLTSWNDMFAHLGETHDVELDQVYTKLIPYKLKKHNSVFCALCDEEFKVFQFLDTHMNAHYCNYMCSDCGDTFVSENRLKHHATTHSVGKHPCRYCGKVFTLERYRRKHEGMVHKDAKLFKCADCGEAFHSEFERHSHIAKNHKERIRVTTCELCGKTFDWKPNYLAHVRKVHRKVIKHKCQYCNKGFRSNHEMKNHEMRHTRNGKHSCVLCTKKFVTLAEMKSHYKRHVNEMQFVDPEDINKSELSDLILGQSNLGHPKR